MHTCLSCDCLNIITHALIRTPFILDYFLKQVTSHFQLFTDNMKRKRMSEVGSKVANTMWAYMRKNPQTANSSSTEEHLRTTTSAKNDDENVSRLPKTDSSTHRSIVLEEVC